MENFKDLELKKEIDDIMDRISSIMEKVDTLDPAKKASPEDAPPATPADVSEDVSNEASDQS